MNPFIAIMLTVFAVVLFLYYRLLKSYPLKLALYYTVCIVGMSGSLLLMEVRFGGILENKWVVMVCLVPLAALMIYCERFIVTPKGRLESEERAFGSVIRAEGEPASMQSTSQQEYAAWRQELNRRKTLHAQVPLEEIEAVIQELSEKTVRPVIWIDLQDADGLPLTASKYGGVPYIPSEGHPPTDVEGRQLRLLAQLNLQELPSENLLPREGLLQFWALNDRMYGFAPHHNNVNGTYRVLYHPQINPWVTEEQVLAKYHPWFEEGMENHFPITHEYALGFKTGVESMGSEDTRWDPMFADLWNKRHPEMKVDSLEDLPNAQDMSEYQPYHAQNKVGGYPSFVQTDRHGEEDVLLLQIPASGRGERRIVWGDFGIANFFISEEALARRDFTDVMYHWDCS